IARGPLIYCIEGAGVSAPVWSLAVSADAPLVAAKRPDLLGGVTVITGEATAWSEPRWTGALYRNVAPVKKVPFTAVPYYAWDNLKPGAMAVWLPTAPPPARIIGPEAEASVSLSFMSDNCQPEGIHDGADVHSSGEQPAELCHWWPHKGGTEWVAYTWDSP